MDFARADDASGDQPRPLRRVRCAFAPLLLALAAVACEDQAGDAGMTANVSPTQVDGDPVGSVAGEFTVGRNGGAGGMDAVGIVATGSGSMEPSGPTEPSPDAQTMGHGGEPSPDSTSPSTATVPQPSHAGDAGAPGEGIPAESENADASAMPVFGPYPPADETLDAMALANGWFMDQHPDPGANAPGNRPSNLWTRGVYYEGLMALYELSQDSAYLDYAVDWGEANGWELRSGSQSDNADSQCAGQTYLDLYALMGEMNDSWVADIRTSIDRMVASPASNAWTWIDAIQMSMPVFARLFALTGNDAYLNKAWDLYSHTRDTEGGGLFNAELGLWWRDADYAPGGTHIQSPNGIDIYWSRGNGWVMAALVRVLDLLPPGAPHRAEYEADLSAMAEALLPLQRSDGVWNTSLADPTHCAAKGRPSEDGPETTGTALFAYGMGWAIRNGVLPEETFGPVVRAAWQALVRDALHEDGFLGYVQSTGAEPCDPDGQGGVGYDVSPDFDDYGLGCFLLAGSEIARLSMP